MAEQSRLEALLEKQRKLEADIDAEKAKEEANKVLNSIGADVATVVQQAAKTAKVDVKVLHGKFFALSVDDGGKLSVEVVTKARKSSGNGNRTTGNGNGNGQYEYFLADGRGGFESVQKAMEALGVPETNRPKHNRYDRLSAEWQKKIIRKAKAEKPAEAEAPAEAPAEAES
ncbi:hypothetical protein ES703_96783 [subsurface metagenome]